MVDWADEENYGSERESTVLSETPSQSEIDDDNSTIGEDTPLPSLSSLSVQSNDSEEEEDLESSFDDLEISSDPGSFPIPVTSVTIIEDFDCTVVTSCKHKVVEFQVSEQVLSLSSAVLKKLLSEIPVSEPGIGDPGDVGGFEQSERGGNNRRLELEGDPCAIETVLQIIHYQGDDETLANLAFDVFAQVVFVCEKYQWHKALRRWTKFWLEKYEPRALEPGFENWLYVAKVFNTTKHVAELTTLLGGTCGIFPSGRAPLGPGNGRYLSRGGKVIDASLWHSETFFQVSRLRDEQTNHLVGHIKALIRLAEYPSEACSSLCLGVTHGILLRSIQEAGLWMLLEKDVKWHGSVFELQRRMRPLMSRFFAIVEEPVCFAYNCPVRPELNKFSACLDGEVYGGTCI